MISKITYYDRVKILSGSEILNNSVSVYVLKYNAYKNIKTKKKRAVYN